MGIKHSWKNKVITVMTLGCLSAGGMVLAATVPNAEAQLTTMEQQVFARSYEGDPVDTRLNRLESTIYGSPKTKMQDERRIQSLSIFLHNQAPQAAPPPVQTASRPIKSISDTPPEEQKLPSESSYPEVSLMEQKVFHKTSENLPIEERLSALEQRVMNHPQQGNLADRTDQLRMIVLGDAGNGPPPENTASNGESSNNSSSGQTYNASASADVMQALPPVEKKILHQTYPGDSVDTRLSRLETKLFNATAPEMSPQDRIYRIMTVANAEQSGRSSMAQGGGPGYMGGRGIVGNGSSGNGAVFGSVILMLLMSFL